MVITPQIFRRLIVVALALTATAIAVDLGIPQLLPSEIREADLRVQESWSDARVFGGGAALLIWLGCSVTVWVGLYRFRSWARSGNLLLNLSLLLVWPLLGYNVASGVSQAFTDVALLVWGAVTALSYIPPLDAQFRK